MVEQLMNGPEKTSLSLKHPKQPTLSQNILYNVHNTAYSHSLYPNNTETAKV